MGDNDFGAEFAVEPEDGAKDESADGKQERSETRKAQDARWGRDVEGD